MLAMQYNISLPRDYDMNIIKNRIAANGRKTDGFPHLNLKAYLVAEKLKYDNYENQYAPFYLWGQAEGINQFLLHGPFNNIIDSFGRPAVHNWIVIKAKVQKTVERQFAFIDTSQISPFADLEVIRHYEDEEFSGWVGNPQTKAYISAYNPLTWELCRFMMSTDLEMIKMRADKRLIYDVHHIS